MLLQRGLYCSFKHLKYNHSYHVFQVKEFHSIEIVDGHSKTRFISHKHLTETAPELLDRLTEQFVIEPQTCQ